MAGEDRAYLDWIRSLPCWVGGACLGAVQPHHRTGAGKALRSHDHETIPLCAKHHDDFHTLRGYFYGWTKADRRSWQSEAIDLLNAKHARENIQLPAPGEDYDPEMPF